MARLTSPLRYPGGKIAMSGLMHSILAENNLTRMPYAEPFAGGCGLALSLLFSGAVSEIHINDIDLAIWSFWNSVLNETDSLIRLIMETEITVDNWKRQKQVYDSRCNDPLLLGFSAFFLNRTNRSGIIKGAGVIGGLEQRGQYKLDCRFNREQLAHRVRRAALYKRRIHLTNLDAVDFITETSLKLGQDCLFCIDPPYFNKGSSLYTNFYKKSDHTKLSEAIKNLESPWLVTYDHTAAIVALYADFKQYLFDINYSVQIKRVESELLIASDTLRLPPTLEQRRLRPC